MKHIDNDRMTIYPIETSKGREYVCESSLLPGIVGGGNTPSEAMEEYLDNMDIVIQMDRDNELPQAFLDKVEQRAKEGES